MPDTTLAGVEIKVAYEPDVVFATMVSFKLSQQDLADILTTAIEGGIQYWSRVENYKWENLPPQSVSAIVWDQEDSEVEVEHKVTPATIATGISRLLSYSPEQLKAKHIGVEYRNDLALTLMNTDIGNVDASDADNLLQIGLFDSIVYG